MYKFNNDHIATSHIKELLHNFHLPMCSVFKDGTFTVEGCLYIKDNNIYKALKNGFYNYTDLNKKSLFKVVHNNYIFGNRVSNITKNLQITNTIYDSYTHKFLGDYLRFYRDYKGIDLMPLYNCYSNEVLKFSTISFNLGDKYQSITGGKKYTFSSWRDENYKTLVIPIRPFNEYTIAIDCQTPVEMVSCYLDRDNLLYQENDGYYFSTSYRRYDSLSFDKPILYDGVSSNNKDWFNMVTNLDPSIDNSKFIINKDKLVLLIKLPNNCDSSIVVLEGNYLNCNKRVFDVDNNIVLGNRVVQAAEPLQVENGMVVHSDQQGEPREGLSTYLSLLQANTKVSYPFADRLIEYLYENVIKDDDYFENNIARVQQILFNQDYEKGKLMKIEYLGVWDEYLKNSILDNISNSGLNNLKPDLLGYVDKDVEKLISIPDEVN